MAEQDTNFDSSNFLAGLTEKPGVYQMIDSQGAVLYVGKAKNLRKRVSSYFRSKGLNNKTMALVARIAEMEVTITRTETEALLLEHNLIKAQRPPYNILLRDDKSYPYIFLSDHDYPRIAMHRGAKRKKGKYFGPYPNGGAVRDSLVFLQKTFRIRPCEDSVYKNRSRPCLQYQINRCSGPCVGLVDHGVYEESVRHTRMFLEGKSQDLIGELGDQMEAASAQLAFERAADLRDQIRSLQRIREVQYIEGENGDLDILALSRQGGTACVQQMSARQGRILGSKSHYPRVHLDESDEQIMAAFVGQFYLGSDSRAIPREILVNTVPEAKSPLSEALTERSGGGKVSILHKLRGARSRWLEIAESTAQENCRAMLASRQNINERLNALAEALSLSETPERIECFDISHSGGEKTVASCVVFGVDGPLKSDYRRFNIEGIVAGDDYAAMGQALLRRYERLQKGEGKLPDILLVDGGKGQMTQAREVLDELGVTGVELLGIAKGPTRKAGLERLYVGDQQRELTLSPNAPALHLLQQIRDEAHRFAITGHRGRRDKERRQSSLEKIPGVGPVTRRNLLRYFGGLQAISRASAEDLQKVAGVSKKMARTIRDNFQAD